MAFQSKRPRGEHDSMGEPGLSDSELVDAHAHSCAPFQSAAYASGA